MLRLLPLLLLLAACSAPEPSFPSGAAADYQLGGAYLPPAGVTLVVRDRAAEPASDVYNVCYVNGFQSQPEDRAEWLADHPELVLHSDGEPLVDENWPDELILDTSTETNRTRLASIVGAAIDDCAGFDAVELDNLDSYLRSAGALTMEDNLAFATALVSHAHEAGLAVGQKNTAELGARGRDEAGLRLRRHRGMRALVGMRDLRGCVRGPRGGHRVHRRLAGPGGRVRRRGPAEVDHRAGPRPGAQRRSRLVLPPLRLSCLAGGPPSTAG